MNSPLVNTVSVIGLGYIGLPTAAMFASRKIRVIGVDVNRNTVDVINRGEIHIVEPDLDMVVHAAVTEGYLRATTEPQPADAFLIAVPTPFKGENHDPDLRYIEAASRAIAPVLRSGNLVILESTSPVGATESMAASIAEVRPDLTFPQTHGERSDIRIAHCPERVLPGKVMQELITNDRVIGGMTLRCAKEAAALYRTFVSGECVIASGTRVAEMAKLTENSFRDVNIAFANELSLICDRLGMDVWELIRLANRHPRVNILQPGPGVGGHCIAVDPWFIVSSAFAETRIIRTAREVNNLKPHWVLEKVKAGITKCIAEGKVRSSADVVVACYGITFKADIDDYRESPALEIVKLLACAHAGSIQVVEPHLRVLPPVLAHPRIFHANTVEKADIHVFLVPHRAFHAIPKPTDQIMDFCGLYSTPASDQNELPTV